MAEDKNTEERLDLELIELLNERRVALPGVQALLAFPLVLPFSSGFTGLTMHHDVVFLALPLCTAGATAMLVAPNAHHRP